MAQMEEHRARVSEKPTPTEATLEIGGLKFPFDISNFDLNAILRGAQLTLVGSHRALQNPDLFTNEHYRQAAIAVAIGIVIRLLAAIPALAIQGFIWLCSLFHSMDEVSWDDSAIEGLHFVEEYVLQVPLFLMTLMRYIDPTLDNLFMQSLQWVDTTYMAKHQHDEHGNLRSLYYLNLCHYSKKKDSSSTKAKTRAFTAFLSRFAKKGLLSLLIFMLSYIPIAGRFVLPAASFYTFKKSTGLGPACFVFSLGLVLPRRYLVIFLQTYYASRSLMRELLEPYFARVHFTREQKRNWFYHREGVLFGFGLGFYILVRVPLMGVLIYGIAEASTAYLVTKITDPPPPPSDEMGNFAASQQNWTNKHEFLSLSLVNLDYSTPASKHTAT